MTARLVRCVHVLCTVRKQLKSTVKSTNVQEDVNAAANAMTVVIS